MNEFGETLLPALMRTGLFLSVSVVVVFLLFRLFRIDSPAVRRWACCVILLQGWFFVQWPVEIPILPASDVEVTGGRSQGFWKSLRSEGSLSDREQEVSISKSPYSSAHEPFLVAVPVVIDSAEKISSQSGNVSWTVCLVFLWGAGILVISCRTLWMYVRFIRELPPELRVEEDWESEWKSLQRQSELRKSIPLYVTKQTGPMLCRFPRGYRLIVPAKIWRDLSLSQRLSILRHELAHVQRRDVWKSLAVRVLALPHWFNPLVWWVVKQFDECAEWACDEAARKATPGHASDYARALLLLGVNTDPVSSLHPAARGRGLAFRVRRLLVSNDLEDSRMKKFSIVMLIMGTSLFGVMRFQLVADEPDKATAADPSVTKSDSTEYRVRLPEQKTGRLRYFLRENPDTGVFERVVLSDDGLPITKRSKREKGSAATKARLWRSGDENSPDIEIRKIDGKYYFVSEYASPRKEASSVPAFTSSVLAFPGHEAVIDMAYIFKNFDEFEQERKKQR
jgi:beta-lactamase regulating signal transducer with metallopeptidase domain